MQIGGVTRYVIDEIWRPSSRCHGFTHFYPLIPEKGRCLGYSKGQGHLLLA